MKVYRVGYSNFADSDCGAEFFSSRREAERAAAKWVGGYDEDDDAKATVEEIEVEPTKKGILRALNRYADHADNG